MAVQPIPRGYHRVNMHLTFKDARKAMEFYKKAIGAEQGTLMTDPTGKAVMHGELRIGDTTIFFADDMQRSGKTVETGSAEGFVPHIWVTDPDSTWRRAMEAGCNQVMPLENQFWGDRYGQVVDPFGLRWAIATHVEDVPPDEIAKRAQKQFSGQQPR